MLRRVTAQAGDVVKVLSAIAVIEAKVEVEAEPVLALTSALTSTSSSRLFVSPRARRLAKSEGVDLAAVSPTGPEGTIVERDVQAYLRDQGSGIEDEERRGRSHRIGASNLCRRHFAIGAAARRKMQVWSGKRSPAPDPRGQIAREDVEVAALVRRSGGAEDRGVEEPRPQVSFQTSSFQQLVSSNQLPASSFQLSGIRALIAERMVAAQPDCAGDTDLRGGCDRAGRVPPATGPPMMWRSRTMTSS